MKRSQIVLVSLTTVALGLTGCRRSGPKPDDDLGILAPENLSESMRRTLPQYQAGDNISGEKPPLNAFDPLLGYYHTPCSEWHPYPYDYYDTRWGYFRCGRWSRYDSTRSYYHSSSGLRVVQSNGFLRAGSEIVGSTLAHSGDTGVSGSFRSPTQNVSPGTPPPLPSQTPPPLPDYDTQPKGAPSKSGVAHAQATESRISRGIYSSGSVSRGGFGSTGHSSSSSSSSS